MCRSIYRRKRCCGRWLWADGIKGLVLQNLPRRVVRVCGNPHLETVCAADQPDRRLNMAQGAAIGGCKAHRKHLWIGAAAHEVDCSADAVELVPIFGRRTRKNHLLALDVAVEAGPEVPENRDIAHAVVATLAGHGMHVPDGTRIAQRTLRD